jgi:hypothetical protein
MTGAGVGRHELGPAGRARGCRVDDPSAPAAIFVRLRPGQDAPGLDLQLARGLRTARARGLDVAHVVVAIFGPLNEARRGQVARLLEQVRASELPATITLIATAPTDLAFLGRQARLHRLAIAIGPRGIVITTLPGEPPTSPA